MINHLAYLFQALIFFSREEKLAFYYVLFTGMVLKGPFQVKSINKRSTEFATAHFSALFKI